MSLPSTCPTPTGRSSTWRRVGPRDPRPRAALRPGPLRHRAARGPPAPSTTRSSPCAAPRPTRRPARSSAAASSTRATSSPRPRSTRSARPASGSASSPSTFAWRLEPGESFTTPEAVVVWTDAGPRRDERRLPRPVPRAPGARPWRDRPRPVLLNNWEATYFDFDADRSSRSRPPPRPRRRAVRARRRLVRPARRHDLARRLGRRPAQAARRARRSGRADHRPRASGSASGSSPRWSARTATCSGAPRLGDRHPRPARTESRQQLVLDMGRPEVVDHLGRAAARSSSAPDLATSSGT